MLNEPVPHQSPDGVIAGYVILFVSRLLPLATSPRSAQQRTGFGTSRAREHGTAEGGIASLTMFLFGVLTVLVGAALTGAVSSLFE